MNTGWCIVYSDTLRPYVHLFCKTKEEAIKEYEDLLKPYPAGSPWRQKLKVGFALHSKRTVLISLELVRTTLDKVYPQALSVQSMAAQFNTTLQDMQLALDVLAQRRYVFFDASSASYLSAIRFAENELTDVPQSSSTIAAKVKLSPTLVDEQLQRLVLLTRAKLVPAPITGAIQYVKV